MQAFYLKPNEAPSTATGTILNGINVEWLPAGPVRLGAMYVYVPDSNIVTRDRLNIYDLRARVHPIPSAPHFWLDGEYVVGAQEQRRRRRLVPAGQLQRGAYAVEARRRVRYASLSGDRPGSARWEGFDPLYFSGDNPNWLQGKIGSSIFNNTNLNAASVDLTLTPDAANIIDFFYLYFAADQTNSPLAIPAVGAAPMSGGGVPSKPLASEFDVAYTYVFNKNVNINAFAAYAAPCGYKELYSSNGGSASGWWFLGTQINFSY